ncbi:Death on curing protein, Doc toxin [uncultured Candidatus Thioglobus sp.]|nr:Death on curing protein, Doc toxin [uncultured Candidatus Thioglobus sp.]
MAQLVWTNQAFDDIDAIAKFIAKDSLIYAKSVISDIFKALNKVEDFPTIGRIVPEIGDENIREVISGNYRIIYRVNAHLLEIITIHHSNRLFNTDI